MHHQERRLNAGCVRAGLALGHQVQMLSALIVGVIVGVASAWQLGLVAVCCVPLCGESQGKPLNFTLVLLPLWPMQV